MTDKTTATPCDPTVAEQLAQLVRDADTGYANRPEGIFWHQDEYCYMFEDGDGYACFLGFALYTKIGDFKTIANEDNPVELVIKNYPVLEGEYETIGLIENRNDRSSTRSFADARRKIIRVLEAATGCKLGL